MSNSVKILVGAIELKVVPKYCSKEEFLRSSIYYDLRDELTYTVPDYKFTTAYKQFHWDGKKVLINKKLISKAGCYQRISRFLSKQGIEPIIFLKITTQRTVILTYVVLYQINFNWKQLKML